MSGAHIPRYPFGPLERLVTLGFDEPQRVGRLAGGWTVADIAQAIGVDVRYIHRWRRIGVNTWQADRIACRLGLHPALIWPDWLLSDAAA